MATGTTPRSPPVDGLSNARAARGYAKAVTFCPPPGRPVQRMDGSVRKTAAGAFPGGLQSQETLALVLLSRRVEGSMWGRLKTLVLAAVVGAAALVPLFGDPRSTPVTHPLWARMLLRSLDMTDAVRASTQASQVFATLAWRDSLSYPADRYLRAEGVGAREEGGRPVLAAAA